MMRVRTERLGAAGLVARRVLSERSVGDLPLQFARRFSRLFAAFEPRHAGKPARDVRPEARRFVHNGTWTA